MIRRVKVTDGHAQLAVTQLFWQVSLRFSGFKLIPEETPEDQPESNGPYVSKLDDIIELVNSIKDDWDALYSEQIIQKLEQVHREVNNEVKAVDLEIHPELWLIRAIALEKSLLDNSDEVEKNYRKCLSGKFQAILVLNNLGVVQARKQRCREALVLFKDAMFWANAFPKRMVKAPFYNFALIIAHLYQQRFVFQPDYLALLSEVIESLPFLTHLKKQGSGDASKGDPSEVVLSDADIKETYLSIAKFAHDIFEAPEDKFFHENLAYLIPELDLLDSFGDVLDKFDREAAHKVFKKGMTLKGEERYAESIYTLEMAGRLAPDYLKGSSEQIEQIFDLWRRKENQDILELTEAEDYEEALRKLQYLPDERLERQNDQGLIESIQIQKQISMLHEADELVARKQYEEAKLKYKALLREDLSDHLRKNVSTKLAALLK